MISFLVLLFHSVNLSLCGIPNEEVYIYTYPFEYTHRRSLNLAQNGIDKMLRDEPRSNLEKEYSEATKLDSVAEEHPHTVNLLKSVEPKNSSYKQEGEQAAQTTKDNLRIFTASVESIEDYDDIYLDEYTHIYDLPEVNNYLDPENVEALRREKSLIGTFPFSQNVQHTHGHHQDNNHEHDHRHEHHDHQENPDNIVERVFPHEILHPTQQILDEFNETQADSSGRKCLQKVCNSACSIYVYRDKR